MALDFGMLQPANIAGNIMAGRQEAQRNQLAQQQLAMGGLQQQHTQMQLEQATRERDALTKMQQAFVANGKSGDLSANFTEMMNSGIPHFVDIGVKGLQSLQNQRNFESLLNDGAAPTTNRPTSATPSAAGPSAPIDEAMTLDYVKNAPAGVSYEDFAASQNTGLTKPVAAPTQVVQARPLQAPGVALPPVTNQLAPATAAPVAPVNQLAPQSDAATLRRKIDAAYALGTPQALAWAQAREKDLAEMKIAPDAKLMQQLGYPLTQAGYQAFRDAQRQERMLTPEEEKQKVRIAAASRAPVQPVAPTITTVEDPNNPGKFLQVDARTYKGGGAGSAGVIGGARPSATAEKTTAQRAQMGKDLGFAITQLADITKDGGLIDQSTGSGAGQLVDLGARFIGRPMPGDIAIGQIAPVADLVLKMVPRFEGPQSNADTKSYKEAAGQLADASLPTKIRKEAGKTVLRLMKERKNQFVTTDMAAEGTGAVEIAPPAGFVQDQR